APAAAARLARAREAGERLDEQRRLADAGIAAEQHHAARDQTAAEHAIELGDAAARAHPADRIADRGDADRRLAVGDALDARACGLGVLELLDQRAPLLTRRAAAEPLGLGVAARLAAV